jgi:hypothetical protein
MPNRDCRKLLKCSSLADFSNRTISALGIHQGELRSFARTDKLKSIKLSNTNTW